MHLSQWQVIELIKIISQYQILSANNQNRLQSSETLLSELELSLVPPLNQGEVLDKSDDCRSMSEEQQDLFDSFDVLACQDLYTDQSVSVTVYRSRYFFSGKKLKASILYDSRDGVILATSDKTDSREIIDLTFFARTGHTFKVFSAETNSWHEFSVSKMPDSWIKNTVVNRVYKIVA